jgi:hypothetical protein
MTAEKFREQIQKELGIIVGPKDPLLALWVAQMDMKEELAAEHQRRLFEFDVTLTKSQVSWAKSAEELTDTTLKAALRAARENAAQVAEEAARVQAGLVRKTVEETLGRLERALSRGRQMVTLALIASIIALVAALIVAIVR